MILFGYKMGSCEMYPGEKGDSYHKLVEPKPRVYYKKVQQKMVDRIYQPTEVADELTLQDVIDSAVSGSFIKLQKNIDEDITISGKEITLFLNGYTIRSAGGDTITVDIDAKLTIAGAGVIDNTSSGMACIVNNGSLVINGGLITRSNATELDSPAYYAILNHGHAIINEAVIKFESGKASVIDNGYYDFSNTDPKKGYVEGTNQEHPELIINGGKIHGGLNTVKNDDNGTLYINGGIITNIAQSSVLNAHRTYINGGHIENLGGEKYQNYRKSSIVNTYYAGGHDDGVFEIRGGKFVGSILVADNIPEESQIIAKDHYKAVGGTFTDGAVADIVANDYMAKKIGGYYEIVRGDSSEA